MKALINKIIPCSFIDGPGSRMAFFFQGCNMRCLYCHNPETQNFCNHCGKCVAACPSGALAQSGESVLYNCEVCMGCDRCLSVCPNFSTPKCSEMSIDDLYRQISHNAAFIDGVTVAGGEATMQAGFIVELFRKIKESTHLTAFIDTNGLISDEALSRLCEVTDGFMVDLKGYSTDKHLELTGAGNALILKTIRFLGKTDRLYEVRTVIVPGFTDTLKEITDIASFVRDLNDYTRFKLIPFRPRGVKTWLSSEPPLTEERFETFVAEAQTILRDRVVT